MRIFLPCTIFILLSFLFPGMANAQIEVVNEGELYISDGQIVHIEGNLTNRSSNFINLGRLGLTGNLTNWAEVSNPGMGLFSFIGTAPQELHLYETFGSFDVEVDNSAGLFFHETGHLQVFNHLSFWDGILYTTKESMLWLDDGAMYSNAYDFSYVNGPMRKTGVQDFIFPIGKDGVMRPAQLSEITEEAVFEAEYFNESYDILTTDPTLTQVSDQEYWYVDNIMGTATARLSLSYDETMGVFEKLEDVRMAHFKQDFWTRVEALPDGGAPVSFLISEDLVSEFGFFTFAKRSFFADLYEFEVAQQEDCSVKAMWVIAPEVQVVNFEVEFSTDSINFVKIGEVAGDTVPAPDYLVYSFTDSELKEEDWLYYRLKIHYPDGTSTYSKVRSLENECPFIHCTIFPNPVSSNNNLNIRFESEEPRELKLQIFDVPGRLLWEQIINTEPGKKDYEILTRQLNLPSAPYFLFIDEKKGLKFIVITE